MSEAGREAIHRPATSVSLVMAACNEGPIIRKVVQDASAALNAIGLAHEIIVVDDGSTDNTAKEAREACQTDPRVRVLSLPRNAGYGNALRCGFWEARHELVAFTDADGQFDLRELQHLLDRAATFDVVCGYRVHRQDAWRRCVASKGFNLLVRTLLGIGVRDCDCALKVMRRDQLNSLDLQSDGFFFNAELLHQVRRAGLKVGEIGVTHFSRRGGESKVSLKQIFPILATLIRYWWSRVAFSQSMPPRECPRELPRSLVALAFLAVAAGSLLFPRLSYPLSDPDETRYVQIAREMLESGDWIVPVLQGRPYLDKPPLLYWMTATSFRIFGISETTARLVPAFAALATILAVYGLGGRLFGPRAAGLSALLMLLSFGFLIPARFVFMDTVLMPFITIAWLAGLIACREQVLHRGWWFLAAMSCGLGILTKGPVALVLCLPPLAAHRWLTFGNGAWHLRNFLLFSTVATGLAIPWFAAISYRESGFLREFILTHHFARFASGLSHVEPWWFYGPTFLVCMLPASLLFPAALTALVGRSEESRRLRSFEVGFLLLATAWTFLLFSASRCKLPPYLLPIVPITCLILGRCLETIINGKTANRFLDYVRWNSPVHLVVMICVGAVVCVGLDLTMNRENRLQWFLAASISGGVILAICGWRKNGKDTLRTQSKSTVCSLTRS